MHCDPAGFKKFKIFKNGLIGRPAPPRPAGDLVPEIKIFKILKNSIGFVVHCDPVGFKIFKIFKNGLADGSAPLSLSLIFRA